jgi:hypothetical protein
MLNLAPADLKKFWGLRLEIEGHWPWPRGKRRP